MPAPQPLSKWRRASRLPVSVLVPGHRAQAACVLCFFQTLIIHSLVLRILCCCCYSIYYSLQGSHICDLGFEPKGKFVVQVKNHPAAFYCAVLKTTLFSSPCMGLEISLTPVPPRSSVHTVLFSTELSLHPGGRGCGKADHQSRCPSHRAPDRFDLQWLHVSGLHSGISATIMGTIFFFFFF